MSNVNFFSMHGLPDTTDYKGPYVAHRSWMWSSNVSWLSKGHCEHIHFCSNKHLDMHFIFHHTFYSTCHLVIMSFDLPWWQKYHVHHHHTQPYTTIYNSKIQTIMAVTWMQKLKPWTARERQRGEGGGERERERERDRGGGRKGVRERERERDDILYNPVSLCPLPRGGQSIGFFVCCQTLFHLLHHRIVQVGTEDTILIKEIAHRLGYFCFSCLLCLSICEGHAQAVDVIVPETNTMKYGLVLRWFCHMGDSSFLGCFESLQQAKCTSWTELFSYTRSHTETEDED